MKYSLTEKVKCKVKNGEDINQSKVCHKFLATSSQSFVRSVFHLSEECSLCVGQLSLLVGGRNIREWRRDAEIWDEEGKLDISIADFPFKLGEILTDAINENFKCFLQTLRTSGGALRSSLLWCAGA